MSALRPRVLPPGFVEPCIPAAAVPPYGPGWLHEIKHDGYRLAACREGSRVRLFSRRDHDWTERFPRIRAALAVLRARSATIDGEAVVCCPKTGLSLFDRLHSGRHDGEVVLYSLTAQTCGRWGLRSARRTWPRWSRRSPLESC